MDETESLSEHDALKHRSKILSKIWHPFTQMRTAHLPIPIVKGNGIYLYSEDGRSYLDGISSWWTNLHGHSHPYIIEKIKSQLEMLEHVIFAGFTHQPAIELASRLLSILPGKMSKIFYSDNGSTATEVAIKMALQYGYNQNPTTQKSKVICFKHSFHGETFGAMSASGKSGFNRPFWNHLFEVESIDPPIQGHQNHSLSQLQSILSKGKSACFIFEPLILGAGGMITYPPDGLNSLMKLCKQYEVLTIADEVMTGFGRTGTFFACEKLNEIPDMICLAKGLTGGFLPMGATVCTQSIFDAFLGNDLHLAFLHGHSYTANPLACSSALASLDLLQKTTCTLQREMIQKNHENFCVQFKEHPKLKRCEVQGTILILEYKLEEDSSYFAPMRNRLYHFFLDRGILLRPLGNVLYLLPPYCIKEEELQTIYTHIIQTLEGSL